MHTDGICAKVIACGTVHLGEFTAMNGADVEQILPTLPHLLKSMCFPQQVKGRDERNDQTFWVTAHFEKAERRPDCKVLSPWIAATRLNSGLRQYTSQFQVVNTGVRPAYVKTLKFPVPNGEPLENPVKR